MANLSGIPVFISLPTDNIHLADTGCNCPVWFFGIRCFRQPLNTKNRKELLATLKEHYWQFLRADNGDMPGDSTPAVNVTKGAAEEGLVVLA